MQKLRVLVVDDEPGMIRVLEHYFRRRGDVCLTAPSGGVALHLVEDHIFDILLSDISMPAMDGLELVKRVKALQPQTVCILMSGVGTRRDILAALQIGVFDFVDKPIPELDAFTMIIDRAAERSRLIRERDALLENLKQQNTKLEFSLRRLHEAFGQLRTEEAVLESDLAQAQHVQRRLLPAHFPSIPGLDLFGYYAPCEQLGGDFFGFVPRVDGGIAVYLADVAGHGVSAAMFTMTLHELIRASVRRGRAEDVSGEPGQVLALINEALRAEAWDPPLYATMLYAVFDPARGRVRIASAGHPAPLWVRTGEGCTPVAVSGPVLGGKASPNFVSAEITLEPGDLLVLHSDGITEALDAEGRELTSERLRLVLGPLHRGTASEIGTVIEDQVRSHLGGLLPHDDMTFVVASCPAQKSVVAAGAQGADEPQTRESVKVVTPAAASVRARTAGGGRIRGGWRGRDCIIRCAGLLTWQQAPVLRELTKQATAEGCASIAIDLAECESMDSTMLGLLLQIAGEVVLHKPTSRVVGLLYELGMLAQFTISHEFCPTAEKEIAPTPGGGGEAPADIILSAHEALMEVSATNRQRFKEVVESLRDEHGNPRGDA